MCSEFAYEGTNIYPPGHDFIPGLVDLPFSGTTCNKMRNDGDGDGLNEGQEYCDNNVAALQGLPAGASHFVSFTDEEGGIQCGCTCAERPVCTQLGHYTEYDEVGAGTYADPFEIWNGYQLWNLSHEPNGWNNHFVQCADVNLASLYSAQRPYFFIPEFSGSYDGRNHAIRNFKYDVVGPFYDPPADESRIGLFANLYGPVSRLKLVNSQIRVPIPTNNTAGALAGWAEGVDLWAITVDSSVWGGGHAGGLVGFLYGGAATNITASTAVRGQYDTGGVFGVAHGVGAQVLLRHVEAVTELEGSTTGGIAGGALKANVFAAHVAGVVEAYQIGGGAFGYFGGEARRVSADVEVDGEWAFNAGGLIGSDLGSTLRETRASGAVSGGWDVGGLIGVINGETPTVIRDSFATGEVSTSNFLQTGDGKLGGLIGATYTWGQDIDIARCYSSGTVQGNYFGSDFIANGGLIGWGADMTITDSFATGAVSGDNVLPFGKLGEFANPIPIDPSNRYNSDVSPFVPDQGTPASLASGVFSEPNTNFGYSWPGGAGGWTFTPGQLPQLTDVP